MRDGGAEGWMDGKRERWKDGRQDAEEIEKTRSKLVDGKDENGRNEERSQ